MEDDENQGVRCEKDLLAGFSINVVHTKIPSQWNGAQILYPALKYQQIICCHGELQKNDGSSRDNP